MTSENDKNEHWIFSELLDSLIMDVASESHRAARLGFDRRFDVDNEEEEFKLSMQARAFSENPATSSSGESVNNSKINVDIFGQTHPAVASEVFECMNCGRPIAAGRFAPHLEKCMGKGRKARLKALRSITSHQRRTRTSPAPVYNLPFSSAASHSGGHKSSHEISTSASVENPKPA